MLCVFKFSKLHKFRLSNANFSFETSDFERIRNNLKQKRNLYDFDQNLNKGQSESQRLDHKIFFSNKHLKE